jgi:hypothetical protein
MLKQARKTRRITRMNIKWIKRLFPVLAILLLAPWPVAYAHDYAFGEPDRDTVRVTSAGPSATPSIKTFVKAIGGVEPGDLFYIDSSDNPADVRVTLYITNTHELYQSFSYMILKVGIYVQSGTDEWKSLYEGNESLADGNIITIREPSVSFLLPGYAKYRMTVDSGSFYCTTAANNDLSPQFYLRVNR